MWGCAGRGGWVLVRWCGCICLNRFLTLYKTCKKYQPNLKPTQNQLSPTQLKPTQLNLNPNPNPQQHMRLCLDRALELTGQPASAGGAGSKRDVWKPFWGAQQRFFKLLCVSLKIPTVVEEVRGGCASALLLCLAGGGGGVEGGGAGVGQREKLCLFHTNPTI